MRILGMHETVMEVMVNVLGGDKSQVCPQLTRKCRQHLPPVIWARILMIPTEEPVGFLIHYRALHVPNSGQNCNQKLQY